MFALRQSGGAFVRDGVRRTRRRGAKTRGRNKKGPDRGRGQKGNGIAAAPESDVAYFVSMLTLSTTNEVCSDESSLIANDSVTVWPLYGSRLKLRIW